MSSRNYGAIRSAEKAVTLIEAMIRSEKPFGFDIEAGYAGPDQEKVSLKQFHPDYFVVGVSFTIDESWARYVPIAHDGGGNVDDIIVFGRALWRLLRTGRGVAHNAAYELKGLSRWFRENFWWDEVIGEEVRETRGMFKILSDTLLMVWLAAEYHPRRIGKDLKRVALAAFNLEMVHFEALFPYEESDYGPITKKGKIRFARFNTRNSYHPTVISYACEDSVATLMLHNKYWKAQHNELIPQVETELVSVLVGMEAGPISSEGVAEGNMFFDWRLVQKKHDEVEKFIQLMGEEILSILSDRLGRIISINLNSVKQLSQVLFAEQPEGLALPVKMRSDKTGAPSTSDDALKVIAKSDPIIKRILEYRQVVKLNSAYLTKFLRELNYTPSGYVFPNHNQAGALTGRMSVDQVSYQQWPKPYHFELASGLTLDFNFRDLFIAPEHYRIVGFDYANVEMRIAGALSGEAKIVDAFNSGKDLHKATAAATFKVPLEAVTDKQRQAAKTLNFAILYGSGASNIAEMLTSPSDPVTKEDAERLLADYLAGYPALAHWIKEQQAHGREQKFVQTHFGRTYTIWEHYEREDYIRAKGDRMAVNAPIQGTAADIIKIAMVRAARKIESAGMRDKIRMALTVHDSIEFLVHESVSTQEVIDLLGPCVSFPINGFPLEIRSDWHEGYQWGAVADIELDKDGKISGYKFKYELPWSKESFKWSGETIRETLDPYYVWEAERFGTAAQFYARYHDDFVIPDTVPEEWTDEQPVPVEEVPEPVEDEAKVVTVTVSELPDWDKWEEFKDFLGQRPGRDEVVFEFPEGSTTMDGRFAITQDDQPRISLILGGANLSISPREVDPDVVLMGDLLV